MDAKGNARDGNGGQVEHGGQLGPDEISEGDAELIGDLGNALDDPEGWMAERPDYWTTLGDAASEQASAPTREAWLRHRLVRAWEALRANGRGRAWLEIDTRTPEVEWIELYESEFGPSRRSAEPVCLPRDGGAGNAHLDARDVGALLKPPKDQRVVRTAKG